MSGIKFKYNQRSMPSAEATMDQMKAKTEQVRKDLNNATGFYARVAVLLDQWVQRNFKSQGGNVGNWVPFKAGGRLVKGGGLDMSAQLLQDTGRLRASFLPFHTQNNAGIGSDLDYAELHNDGLGNLPERRMLPQRIDVMDKVNKLGKKHLVEVLDKKVTR